MSTVHLARAVAALMTLAVVAPSPAAGSSTGTLVEMHGDRLDRSAGDVEYRLETRSRSRRLSGAQPRALVGQRVRIEDADPATSALDGNARAAESQRVTAAPPPGPRSLLVILLTFNGASRPMATPAQVRSALFTAADSANALFEQQSEGATRLVGRQREDGDVTDPLRLDIGLEGCPAGQIASLADAAATSAGFSPDAYDHVMYALPNTRQCDWGGLGELPGRRSWSNGYLLTQVTAHELGHNMGAHHANSLDCTSGGVDVTVSESCTSEEYGDPFDVMGLQPRLMSSWHRSRLGQLPVGQTQELLESQSVALTSADTFGPIAPRLALVPRKEPGLPVASWFAIETRSPSTPFGLFAPGAAVTRGLSVRIVGKPTETLQTQLLDARPDTSGQDDAALLPGETLRDAAHDITITAERVGAGLQAAVSMPKLVDDVPPSAPRAVVASGDTTSVDLSWQEATDDVAVDHYEIEREGVIAGSTPEPSFVDREVTVLRQATYRVVAVDASGNRAVSEPVSITLADVTPPGEVTGLRADVNGRAVDITWAPAADNREVVEYRVTRGSDALPSTSGTGTGLQDVPPPGTIAYAVRAVDPAGNVGPAATVTVTVPDPVGVPVAPLEPATSAPASGVRGITVSQNPERPKIRLVSWGRRARGGAWVHTVRFSTSAGTSLRAYRETRLVGRSSSSKLTLRVRSSRQRPLVLKVVATSPGGRATGTWTRR